VLRTTDISCSSLTSRSRLLIIFCSLVSLSPSAVVFFPYTTLFRSVIGIPYSSAESNSVVQVDAAKEAAESLDEEIEEVAVTNTSEVAQGVESFSNVDAIYVPTDNTLESGLETVISYCIDNQIPVLASESDSLEMGTVDT